MLIKIRRRLSIVALVIVFGAMSLSGCSANGTPSPSESRSSVAPSTEAGASPQQESEGSDAPAVSSGEKPSRADVAEGFLNIAKQARDDEFPADYSEKVAQCFVDSFYDKVTATTLNAIAEEKVWEIEHDDFPVYTQVSAACGEEFGN